MTGHVNLKKTLDIRPISRGYFLLISSTCVEFVPKTVEFVEADFTLPGLPSRAIRIAEARVQTCSGGNYVDFSDIPTTSV